MGSFEVTIMIGHWVSLIKIRQPFKKSLTLTDAIYFISMRGIGTINEYTLIPGRLLEYCLWNNEARVGC